METLTEDFRKTIQLQNDVMDLMAGMGYDESTRGIFEHKANTEEEKKVEKRAKERLNQLLREIRQTNLGDNYVDSDQSPLKGIEAQVLRNAWADGLDIHPANGLMSPWAKALFSGDYEETMRMLDQASDVSKLLEKRESLYNISAIFFVIIGSRCLTNTFPQFDSMRDEVENKEGHTQILSKLLELGSDLSARDIAGYTPLHHCLTAMATPTTLNMAVLLLKAGADPNLQNRFGASPLFECIMSAKLDAVKLLLHFGGRFDVMDNDGTTCFDLASHFPKVNALVSEAGAEAAKKARAEKKLEGAFKCGAAGCGRHGSKRCTGCYLVYFCSDTCFKETWATHKSNCKETRAQYKTVKLTTQFMMNLNYRSNQVTTSKGANTPPAKKHFVVKVQVPQGLNNEPLMVYNEDRSMMGVLKKASAPQVYDNLVVSIDKRGVKGLKGFFYAIYKKEDASSVTLEINPEVVLPPEKW